MAIVKLVVVEDGSEVSGVEISDNTIVGHYGRGLRQRIQRRLDALERQGDVVRVAELVCSDWTEGIWVADRAEVAHELLTIVASRPRGQLVLSASGIASTALRNGVFALAGVLSTRLPGTMATVSVRFGAPNGRAVPRGPVRPSLAMGPL